MKIAIGADHAGYELKTLLGEYLRDSGHDVEDFGVSDTVSVDYPDYALPVAKSVAEGRYDFGVLVCGSGIGVSITANKVQGVRAANCLSAEMADLARRHNNANVLTLGSRLTSAELAKEILSTFLATEFEGGRHSQRVNKIHELTGC